MTGSGVRTRAGRSALPLYLGRRATAADRGDAHRRLYAARQAMVAALPAGTVLQLGYAHAEAEGTWIDAILLQNRGSFFPLDDHHPNRLEPGKRTFHTLIPAMLFEGETFEMAFGTMGGEGQPQTQAALLTRLLDFGYDVQQAIEAPRWLMGRTWGTARRDLSLEGRVPDEVARELLRRGQPVNVLTDWNDNMGHAQAIRRSPQGFLEGGADPRGDGAALGY